MHKANVHGVVIASPHKVRTGSNVSRNNLRRSRPGHARRSRESSSHHLDDGQYPRVLRSGMLAVTHTQDTVSDGVAPRRELMLECEARAHSCETESIALYFTIFTLNFSSLFLHYLHYLI